MRGLAVFTAFFGIFLVSSLALPLLLFPGNIVCFLLGVSEVPQTGLLSALVNGVFYGFIAWTIVSLGFRWIEQSASKKRLPDENKE